MPSSSLEKNTLNVGTIQNRVGCLQKGIPRNVQDEPRCFLSFVHSPFLYRAHEDSCQAYG